MAEVKERGLYQKYIVEKIDSDEPVDAVVLEFKDPIARMAIQSWACKMYEAGYINLYYDIQNKLDAYKNKLT